MPGVKILKDTAQYKVIKHGEGLYHPLTHQPITMHYTSEPTHVQHLTCMFDPHANLQCIYRVMYLCALYYTCCRVIVPLTLRASLCFRLSSKDILK